LLNFDCIFLTESVTWKAIPCASLEGTIDQVKDADVIGVDEGQFVCCTF
jgi:hypothetical protein